MHTKIIAVGSYSRRIFPIEIRSTLLGNISVGQAVFQLIIIQAYDYSSNRFGSSAPFMVASGIDFLLLISIFVLGACGLIES